jgi:hypothetical protein
VNGRLRGKYTPKPLVKPDAMIMAVSVMPIVHDLLGAIEKNVVNK